MDRIEKEYHEADALAKEECKSLVDENNKPYNYEEFNKCVENVYKKIILEKIVELPVHEMPDTISKRIGTIVIKLRDNITLVQDSFLITHSGRI